MRSRDDLPEGWEVKRLGDVCQYDKSKNDKETVPYVGLEHIESKTGKFIGTLDAIQVKSSTFSFSNKHILYGRLRPYLNKVLIPNFAGHCSTEIFPIKVNATILREFLFHWLTSETIVEKIDSTCTGTRMPRANMKEVIEFSIPIPPISEQKRIVAILDKAFSAIDQAKSNIEKNIDNAKELFQSKLNEIFSQKGEGWEERQINEISTIVNGFSFKSNDFSSSNPIKSIKITNVGVKKFIEENENNLPNSYSKDYSGVKVKNGDLVLALTRTIISSGLKIALVPKSYDGALLNQRVAAIIPDPNIIDPNFLYYYFCSKEVFDYILSNVNTLMQPNLSIKDLKRMPIPVYPILKQREISNLISSFIKFTEEIETILSFKLGNLEELKKSILQKAFKGEL